MRLMVRPVDDKDSWDLLVNDMGGNPFQLWGWGDLKAQTGSWEALRLAVLDEDRAVVGGAQVLLRTLPFPFRMLAYVPRGPFGKDDDLVSVADAVADYLGAKTPAVSVLFEPAVDESFVFNPRGSQRIESTILLPSTLILDLTQDEDALMADMRKKTRYEVRKSLRQGLVVEKVSDTGTLEACLDIYDETGDRADFALHGRGYYRSVFRDLGPHAPLYAGYVDGELAAFVWLLASASTSVELYGGSNEVGRKAGANYGLKWEAILDQKRMGVRHYDLNGLLGEGITQFKTGFASHRNELHPPVEIPLSALYPVWVRALPVAREWMSKAKGAGRAIKRHFSSQVGDSGEEQPTA